ncbi:chitosanase [Streptomyces sp. NPDC052077]|uniref:chitosanase n=1 Tax=Streptomyces sp. NPDC052077 TaxID=3154757 RepID=UPI00341FACDF
MKRAGVLLLVAAPVVVTGAYLLMPADTADAPSSPSAVTAPAASREAGGDRADGRAEGAPAGLASPEKKELAQQLVSSAENSTVEWRTSYGAIEDDGHGDGYTAGIIGFCTGTHDLLALVERYTRARPDNGLARYLPALRAVDGTGSHEGLDPGFPDAWRAEAEVPAFRKAQEEERDRVYFDPAVRRAERDGLGALGQFVYYDAMVFHGPDTGPDGFYGLRERAAERAATPAVGGSETDFLNAFLDVRRAAMLARRPGIDTSRIDTAQRRFLEAGNLALRTPLTWQTYGDTYRVP